MAREHHDEESRHVGVWIVATLGAAAGAAGGWLWARTRRDRLVAEAGTVAHAADGGTTPDDVGTGSAAAEPED
ncbi:MAG: hypothetical protein ACTIJJ_04075 [Galactobacter sp.]|uniref:hypothetical protein n=1 Tax=Galactobacter sp. TaxID=2676125 RepID=UPI0025C720BC|nr:hypothetical protein [Galactobacter sp.]